jgi:hypothetical protein
MRQAGLRCRREERKHCDEKRLEAQKHKEKTWLEGCAEEVVYVPWKDQAWQGHGIGPAYKV